MKRKIIRNKTPIKCGDRILAEAPFVYVLKSKYRTERCDNCLAECRPMKRCNCQYVNYCNNDCQAKSWGIHQLECPLLKRNYPNTISDTARMLCRLIIMLSNGGHLIRSYYTSTNYRRFWDLMSHYAEIRHDSRRLKQFESLHTVLCDMMGDSMKFPNKLELLAIYGRLLINSFHILDAEMNSIGTGIYLGVSISDHSCKPNAVVTFEGTTLCMQAIEDMPCLNWQKIFISYIDLLKTPAQRCEELMSKYYFSCTCKKCVDPHELKEMNAAACPNRRCPELLDIARTSCPRCGARITAEYRQSFDDAMLLTRSNLEDTKEVIYLDVCKICLQKQRNNVHPLNLWHIKTLDAAFEALIEAGKWRAALRYGIQLLPGYHKYYGKWNPLVGLLYMKIAKVQLCIGSFRNAMKNLEEAKKILIITHGHDHSLVEKRLPQLLLLAREKKKCFMNEIEKLKENKIEKL